MQLTENDKKLFFLIQESINEFYNNEPNEFIKIVDVHDRLLECLKEKDEVHNPEMEAIRILVDVYRQDFNMPKQGIAAMMVVLKDKIEEFKNRTLN